MLFTWDITNLCIVFRWWHVRSTPGLLLSLLAVVAIAAGYEALRAQSRRFERWASRSQNDLPSMYFLSLSNAYASVPLFRFMGDPKAETARPWS
jgi:copper transporter 1